MTTIRELFPRPNISVNEKALRPLIYGFNCMIFNNDEFVNGCVFLDPETFSMINMYFSKSGELFRRISIYDIKNVEIKEPVTILADPALEKQTKRSSAELLEIELDIGEFVLLSIKDPKLKASVSSALLTVDALTVHSPFCRFAQETLVEFVLHKGHMLGGAKRRLGVNDVKSFLCHAKSFTSEQNMLAMVKEMVADPEHIRLEELRKIALLLIKKPELRELFAKHCKAYRGRDLEEVMGFEEFAGYLEAVQGEKVDKRFFQEMLAELKNPQSILGYPRTNNSQLLNFIEFSNLVFSDFNLAMDPQMDGVFQEMDKPLSEYYISALSNTYAREGQMSGNDTTCKAYYEAVKSGCRCIELETWDGTKGEPVVASSRNLASMLLFEDVVKCLAKWAFKFSDFPFFLFVENHCDLEQMIKMKKIMSKHFGDAIYRVTEKEFLNEKFPSPEKLKKKIVIKTKSAYSHKKFVDKLVEKDKKRDLIEFKREVFAPITSLYAERFRLNKMNTRFGVANLSESELEKLVEAEGLDSLMEHNLKYLTRVVPDADRPERNNLDAMEVWNTGAQLAAINAQLLDREALLNYGMFRRNGGCGVVRKPDRVRDPSVKSIIKGKLQLKLVSGQNLGHLIEGPSHQHFVYIELEVVDMVPGAGKGLQKSSVVQYNLFHPVWQDAPAFEFEVRHIDCCILFVRAVEAKEGLILGRTAIPVDCIRNGLRVFDLLDAEHDTMIHSKVLFEVKMSMEANLFGF